MSRSYDLFADLSLTVDGCLLDTRNLPTRSFDRRTTVVRLRGRGEEGYGEDVTYEGAEHLAFLGWGARPPVDGKFSFDEFSRMLASLDLFPESPRHAESRAFRRWAFESAALDLALRQSEVSLERRIDRPCKPVRFVVSMGLGHPATTRSIRRLLRLDSTLRFKLDVASSWTDEIIDETASLDVVDVLDFKGLYSFNDSAVKDPARYRRILAAFPAARIEDPVVTDETTPILEPHAARISWDACVTGVEDLETLAFPPSRINLKPSRFGSLASYLDTYDHCASRGIELYGGGQFELGCGREQVQYLASMFHPDAPNDVAPVGFHESEPRPGLPVSPLTARPTATGFRWKS